MPRIPASEANNYGTGGNSFFSLKNDKDMARVRFMYNSVEDISVYAVHEIELDGNRRVVNCLREYSDPKHICPLCNAGFPQKIKLYIPVYDIDADEVKLWDRGRSFLADLTGQCARYSNSETPIVANIFEIERHGAKGDKNTKYMLYRISADNTRLSDLPEVEDPIGTVILDKSADELEYFLERGEFPNGTTASSSRSSSKEDTPSQSRGESRRYTDDYPTGRRTPPRRDNF